MSSGSKYDRWSESAPGAPPTEHEIEDYTVGWVCALPLEMAAAKGMLERVHPNLQQDPADHNSYILGEVWGHNVAVACLPAGIYGTASAATVASNMLRTFKSIRFGLMVGIGGGVPSVQNDIRLGDIVVSQPTGTNGGVIQYDRGKTLQHDGFHRTGVLNTPPQILLTALSRLQAEHFTENSRVSAFLADLPHKMRERFSHPGLSNDSLFQAHYLHVGSHSTCVECDHTQTVKREDRDNVDPVIHYGTIASGNQVIKDAELRNRLGQQFGVLCLEMEAAGLQDFPSIVIRGISDYADSHKNKQWQFYAAAVAAAFAKELLSMIPPYRVLQEMPIKQMVADNSNQEYLFWVVGPAEIGKSTLIRSIADHLNRDKRLVAGYFFKRGEQGRNDTKRLFATLAMQLTDTIPSFKEALRVSLGDIAKDSMDTKDLRFQFEKLLKEPLQQLSLSQTSQLSKIIVLDALDECERPEHLARILAFLLELCNNTTGNLQLRILLTSRPDPRVIRAFESLGENKHICKLALHRMFPEDTKSDIRMYLETKLSEIRVRSKIQQDPWPSVEDVDRLVDLATYPEPLFIYAATLIRFLYDEKYLRNPNSQLKIWLNQCSDNASQLSQMYNPILEQIFTSASEADFDQQLHFLNATVLAPTPLSLSSLASLLGLHIDDINCWLPGFHAVLDIPSEPDNPIRLLHKSFSDYLHSKGDPRHDHLRMDPSETHALLADRCIDIMTTGGLKRDICGLEKLDATSDAVHPDTLNRCIPSQVQYACLYWVHHLQACEDPLGYGDRIYDFLLQHFLNWLEALALQKRLSDSIKALRDLMNLIKQLSDMPSELLNFLQDASRTILSFGSIIESAPLQTYASLLLFSPEASLVRQHFWNQRLPALSHIGGIHPEWDAYLWTFHVGCLISGLAFSPDGRFLASADDGVHLWNASTGTYFTTLEDKRRTNRTIQIQFSSNSQLFAAVNGEVLRVWDITTWAEMPRIRCQSGLVVALAFSEDCRLLMLAAEDSRVEYWDVRTGMHQKTIAPPQYLGRAIRIAFSPNCQFVALVHEGIIRLWTLATGATKEIHHRYGHADSLAFSPDSKALVSGICPWLQVWNTETGALEYELEDNPPFQLFGRARIETVAFSPDNQLLASGSGTKVRLWNLTTRDFCDFDIGGGIYQAVFSPDCQLLATGLSDNSGKIKIWDIIYADRGSLHDRGRCCGIHISPNGKLVVSQSDEDTRILKPVPGTLQLWDASTGILQRTLKYEDAIFNVQFSRDSKSVKFRTCQDEPYIWDITTGTKDQIHGLQAKEMRRPFLYSEDGQLAAVRWDDGAIKLYFATSGAHLSTIEGHKCGITAIAISPNSETLAVSLSDKTIRVWSTKTGELNHQFHLPIGKPTPSTLVLSPRGTVLISINRESIDWWSVDTGSHLDTHKHGDCLIAFASSPNLTYLAEALVDHNSGLERIELYYPGKGDRKALRVHSGGVVHIVFSPDNRLLSVASKDRTVCLWDVATSTHIKTFQTYNDIPEMVKFSQDGQIIAVASKDRTTRIWNTSTGSFYQMVQYDQGFIQNMILLPNELRILVSDADDDMSWDSNFKLTTHSYDLLCDNEVPRSEPGYCGINLDVDGIWIMQDSEKLVFIPPEYRPELSSNRIIARRSQWARTGTVLFIGTRSGRVIRYSLQE
ncbi:hypothetical protein BFJ63_vAg17556 [Fusarium oxysporum f. sp. narcissi]|uniref:Uncharacterized protein n=1 Tax=Fusarium oxysporum f. sp. narcissi TaxID=451672 RepID=A0A4Q2V3Y2_FUSOX|nr:hypothetical protein BFJ63_vAg17556 [Fusarium oxysporum f. sp. narcissi]